MTFKEIKELIEVFDNSELAKLSVKEGDFKIELDKNSTQQIITQPTTPVINNQHNIETPEVLPSIPVTTDDTNADYIKSPMVGTFYQAPAPDKPAFVKVGSKVKTSQSVCIVEAMKIMNEIQAEFDCEILEVLVEDGQAVEFDTPLFKVKRV
jgi:acetyl-CoA carboxylase biotin carboxyl carrier protein